MVPVTAYHGLECHCQSPSHIRPEFSRCLPLVCEVIIVSFAFSSWCVQVASLNECYAFCFTPETYS